MGHARGLYGYSTVYSRALSEWFYAMHVVLYGHAIGTQGSGGVPRVPEGPRAVLAGTKEYSRVPKGHHIAGRGTRDTSPWGRQRRRCSDADAVVCAAVMPTLAPTTPTPTFAPTTPTPTFAPTTPTPTFAPTTSTPTFAPTTMVPTTLTPSGALRRHRRTVAHFGVPPRLPTAAAAAHKHTDTHAKCTQTHANAHNRASAQGHWRAHMPAHTHTCTH